MSEERDEVIKGYRLTAPWNTSGSAQWTYAEKDGREWFLKRFLAPKYKRAGDGIPQRTIDNARALCDKFKAERGELYRRIRKADTGNIVPVLDFFDDGTSFYAASPRIDVAGLRPEEVYRLPRENRLLLMKILTHCIQSLHENKVIHGDIKPSNVILKQTVSGGYTLKLIDFDAGFLEEAPRSGKSVSFDPVYVAPETVWAMDDPAVRLNGKIDIFALGLMFHLFYCGSLPGLPEGCLHAAQAVANEDPVQLSDALPYWLKNLISRMLQLDPKQRPAANTVLQWLTNEAQPIEIYITGGFHRPDAL